MKVAEYSVRAAVMRPDILSLIVSRHLSMICAGRREVEDGVVKEGEG